MSYNREPSCCFDASMYTGTPDSTPCSVNLDIKRIIAELDKLLYSGDDTAAGEFLDRWCAKAAEVGDWRSELTLQSELMGYHRRTNDEKSALNAVNRGLEIIKDHRLGSTISGATILLNAATTLKAYGMADRSIPMFIQVCRVYASTLDPLDYRFGGLYNNMALALVDEKQYDEARRYYEKALAVMANVRYGQLEQAITYLNLADLATAELGLLESEDQVNDYLDRAEALLETPEVPRNGYYAFVCEKCAPTFRYFGRFAYADELKQRSDAIYERS